MSQTYGCGKVENKRMEKLPVGKMLTKDTCYIANISSINKPEDRHVMCARGSRHRKKSFDRMITGGAMHRAHS